MNKIILKIIIILLFCIIAINIITSSSYAKYYITQKLEAINIEIKRINEVQEEIIEK